MPTPSHWRSSRFRALVREHALTHAQIAEILRIQKSNARAMTCGARIPSDRMLRLFELELRVRGEAAA